MPSASRVLRVSVARSSALHLHHRDLAAPVERDAVSGADWAAQVAALAHDALIGELETWPKPGLVSPVDSGSHDDMDADTLRRSAAAIRPYFAELVEAGARAAAMAQLRTIGMRAEAAMMRATSGINAHRGAIFSLGLICAAAGAIGEAPETAEACADTVRHRWGDAIAEAPASPVSHGGRAARRYGVGGASAEAAAGFPTIRSVGLPALRHGRGCAPGDAEAARVQCFFALLAVVDDTNLLHRGGAEGLAGARSAAADFMAEGGIAAPGWRDRAVAIHRAFVAARLSPGGCADLLAATLLLDALARPPGRGA
ncbi:2-(5''-triphosphoribosyl)-3'-dephosphocoenzyme-A synthase [Methylobacterium tardum]|uniref:Probable 2-(5''-triphosphoribosyl)-3'-dephosphocoenzyme-A synthase n=1 Tax=Methylobacterium tardum TaxID=374432 RepID=A0AA37WTH3_9HYPH|nr:triphosphoribosyl-dephospho-CoA synthase MdcB [Methylobacterium tardum]URD39665.1 triphosphoribosyl-dephospho-CoA synthase MdcB [Methylobacterium tardum]GJE48677.1 2-(5''-triphosphoribosyl)-3'-dephosphocoenzyme-A synthase [Methylobacterium tardum]GLS72431.1 putative 2-(5''-triphosphoribosyl)-3'-dephosphocoenzyme-A synthase [Methylobacterium tardum]